MSRLRNIWERYEPNSPAGKQFYDLHNPTTVDRRDKASDAEFKPATKASRTAANRQAGNDERAYDSGRAPGQFDQTKPGFAATSLPHVVTQEEWPDGPYMQPVSEMQPSAGWQMRQALQEMQRQVIALAGATNLRLELIKEEADGSVFRFASVTTTHPAANSPDLVLQNLYEHLKDTATIQEVGRRCQVMEPTAKVWDTIIRIQPKGAR
jgi:hypothetical protein